MRLLHAKSRRLVEFPGTDIPPYAILSHTWGDREVTFEELRKRRPWYMRKEGFAKIAGCCRQALNDGIKYVWIDTCCVDKSSSAELSEAINSMFQWYQRAERCYAYLADVTYADTVHDIEAAFNRSRWFTRGWTLQELLAPSTVVFFDSHWAEIGEKSSLAGEIHQVTGIGAAYLRLPEERRPLYYATIAERMSWAAKRQTTREEDMAYSLLGIFGVNMPLLYGEGSKAFIRLQEEIMKTSGDQSLFAWGLDLPQTEDNLGECLASSASRFVNCGDVLSPTRTPLSPFAITNIGLRIDLPVCLHQPSRIAIAIIDCTYQGFKIGIPLRSIEERGDTWAAERYCPAVLVNDDIADKAVRRLIYIRSRDQNGPSLAQAPFHIGTKALDNIGWNAEEAWPPYAVLDSSATLLSSWFSQFFIKFSSRTGEQFMVRVDAPDVMDLHQPNPSHPEADTKRSRHVARLARLQCLQRRESVVSVASDASDKTPSELHEMVLRGNLDKLEAWTDSLMVGGMEIMAETFEYNDRYGLIFTCLDRS